LLYSAHIEIEVENAEVIARALMPDDLDWARASIMENKILIDVETGKIGALINAIEDFFMNIKSALHALDSMKKD